ncbi:B-box zinc finger family protein [Leishmania donovani]|uniref:B-box zinc finger family protein n=1 Tax=Leishmania donovani TaxID=5661 RepID=A0A504X4A7_LEIDO|nr:B-box zinc finger family protein [Leishmania donovani]
MAATSPTPSQRTYLRIVVYCDDSQEPHTLPDVRVPRSVSEVQRLVEGRVGQRAMVLSYWNYTHSRYELLKDVRELLQEDGRLLSQRLHTSENEAAETAEADGTTNTDGRATSASELGAHHSKLCIYRCQLWMETTLIQLEPLDKRRDKIEYDELRSHVACWLGNKHVGFEVQDAMRIRCPFLTRMFDETRSRRLSANQDKVQLLYYSNNAWSVRVVLQYGFLLSNGVPQSLAAVLQSCGGSDVSSGTESGSSNPVPHVGGGASAPTSPSSASPTAANTRRTPFVFTSSMLSAHVKYMPPNTAPHKVLLCEVAPGRRFMTDQGLTGESPDKQAYPTPPVKPPRGYDSVCYMRAHKQKTSLRTEDAAEIAAEDLSLVQVQVQHSYQALPRYLLTIYNMKEWFKSSPRRGSVSADNGANPKQATSPHSTSGLLMGMRYADSTAPYQRAASATTPGRGEASKQRRAAQKTRAECDEGNTAYHGGGGLIEPWALDSVPARGTGTAGRSDLVTGSPWASGVYSAGNGGFRNASPSNRVSYGGVRAASAPRAPPTQHLSPLSPYAAQVSPSTNSAWGTGGLMPSLSFHGAYNAHSSHNRLLYESLPRDRSATSRDTAYLSVPAAVVRSAGRRAASAGAPLPAAHHGAPSRPPLLPPRGGVRGGGAMGGGGIAGPTLKTVPPASATAPFTQRQAPPATLDQFTCDIHPRQIKSLYCMACEELTCSYCASVGAHRSHVVVEAAERATAVCAKAEALHEALRHSLTQCEQTEEQLRAEQARYAGRQQRDLCFVQRQFSTLNQALQQAERSMTQMVQEAQRRPPLAEAAAVATKYTQALAALDAALRRYYSTVAASSSGPCAERTCGPTNRLLELLHFLRTTSSLIGQVEGSIARRKDEEKRLRDAIVSCEAQAQTNEALFQQVDWAGLRRLLVSIGNVRTNMDNVAEPQPSTSAGPFRSGRTAPPSLHEATALSMPGAAQSRPNSAKVRARTQTLMALSSPRRDASSDAPQRLLDSLPAGTLMQSENGAAASPPTLQNLGLHRCLTDLQRGYIWVIQSATSYFAPGQRKIVCSTPFRLLGVSWELRVAPLPRARRHDGSASSTPMVEPGINGGVMDTAASRLTPPNVLEGGGRGLSGSQARTSLLLTHSAQEDHYTFAAEDVDNTLVTSAPSSDEGEEEWLGLFLFPLQHRLRIDFRVIAFSEVAWAEWQVTGWTARFAGKGWGLYPFLQRRELLQTDELARDNMVKICIAPISDLY